jgi:4'-phosphopantetheinyl transferase
VVLFPVVLPVVEEIEALPREEKVALLRRVSREALKLCAEKTGVVLSRFDKDGDDVPLPTGGHYWSVSHKPKYVAAVIANDRVGIDLEEIRPRPDAVFRYVASDEEWTLGGGKSLDTFFRYWTAKEAVVKATGIGLRGLRRARIVSIPDRGHINVDHQGRVWQVEQRRHDGHIVAVTKDGNEVEWVMT